MQLPDPGVLPATCRVWPLVTSDVTRPFATHSRYRESAKNVFAHVTADQVFAPTHHRAPRLCNRRTMPPRSTAARKSSHAKVNVRAYLRTLIAVGTLVITCAPRFCETGISTCVHPRGIISIRLGATEWWKSSFYRDARMLMSSGVSRSLRAN